MAKSGLSRHVPLSPQAVCPIVLLFVAPRPRAASPEGRRPTAKCRGICFYKESTFSLYQPRKPRKPATRDTETKANPLTSPWHTPLAQLPRHLLFHPSTFPLPPFHFHPASAADSAFASPSTSSRKLRRGPPPFGSRRRPMSVATLGACWISVCLPGSALDPLAQLCRFLLYQFSSRKEATLAQ